MKAFIKNYHYFLFSFYIGLFTPLLFLAIPNESNHPPRAFYTHDKSILTPQTSAKFFYDCIFPVIQPSAKIFHDMKVNSCLLG